MKKQAVFVFAMSVFLLAMVSTATGGIIFVDTSATGANDGLSWADAYNYLQDGLAAAASGDEIWVAEGTYKPDQGGGKTAGDRKAAFGLINGVAIYGGFPAGGSNWEDSDPNAYETTLSGDLNGDDVEIDNPKDLRNEPTRSENSYQVVIGGSGIDETAVLDGFAITGGNANGNRPHSRGGGIYGDYSSPTISNCVISGNWADWGGAGIYNCDGPITNCTITANAAIRYGGGLHGCDGAISNCTITDNWVSEYGGGIFGSKGSITNCTISNNTAEYENGGGGGIYLVWNNNPTITNSTITRNTAKWGSGGGIYCGQNSSPIIINCTISDNMSGGKYRGGGGIYCGQNSSPIIINSTITRNTAKWGGGGILCGDDSRSTITNCTISGNMASEDSGGVYGYNSNSTIINCTIIGNKAGYSSGGIGGSPTITNCIIWNNAADRDPQLSSSANPTYSCIQDWGYGGQGNIIYDPCFVEPGYWDSSDYWNYSWVEGDYHLQSAAGRWDPNQKAWVEDIYTSPCIDAGDPAFVGEPNETDMDGEPRVMGGRVDIGADEVRVTPNIIVPKPVAGDIWACGSIHEIKWSSYGLSGTVDILYSSDDGGSWQTVESGITNTGSYIWQLPDKMHSEQCLVSVVPSVPDANVACTESGLFEIRHFPRRSNVPLRGKSPKQHKRKPYNYGPELGCVKWRFETGGPVTAGVTQSNNGRKLYVACEDGKLYTLGTNGTALWNYDTNSPLLGSPGTWQNGMVHVGGEDGKLYTIDARGGLRWTHRADGPIYSSPVVSLADGKIYVCSLDGVLYALGADGSELWSFETGGFAGSGGSVFASPAAGADGTVYIAGLYDPNLYALDPNDGSVKWTCNFEFPIDPCDPNSDTKAGWPFASPVVAEDGTIYQTLLFDTNLYAI
ncbi:MAG TPA: hypothetical protein ENH34_04445, partial [Phycisphaerales bacterium]|nr:hypothetical protein [Phycisphaerales bacterium]